MSDNKIVTGVSRFIPVTAMMAVAAFLTGCAPEEEQRAEIVRPVKVMEIAAADRTRQLEYAGSVKARSEINMSFRVSGKVTERSVDIGQRVKPGDLLARIDSADYELAVARSEADLASATKQVQTLELAKRRAEQLFARNAASRSELETRTLSYDQALSAQKSALSALDQVKNQVAYTRLHADVAGIVTATSVEPGQVVGSGTPVVTVAIDGEKEVQIAVPEMDIAQFSTGQKVTARFWADEALRLDGTVREVAGSADPQSRTFSVRVSLPDDGNVLLGMTATIDATTQGANAAFALPLTALSQKDGRSVVWLVDSTAGTVSARPVLVGEFIPQGVNVLDGIKTGDIVVTAGTQFMKDGMKVRIAAAGEYQTTAVMPAQQPVR